MKCVMIIDSDLDVGLQINAAAALGISLSNKIAGLVGKTVKDADSNDYEGVVNIPVPILGLNRDDLKNKALEIRNLNNSEITMIIFTEIAQKSLTYDSYEIEIGKIKKEKVEIVGLCLYGPPKIINRISGNIKLIR